MMLYDSEQFQRKPMEHRDIAGDGDWSKGHSHGPDHMRQLAGREWPEKNSEDKLDLFLLEPVFTI